MRSTYLRQQKMHGLMLGCGVAEALALARAGLDRRTALKLFGRPPLQYRLLPGFGIYGPATQLVLLSAQAILNSRSDQRAFEDSFSRRLKWYCASLPSGLDRVTRTAGLKTWGRPLHLASAASGESGGAESRALFLALVLHGTGHRISRWVDGATKLTHKSDEVAAACQALAALAQIAGNVDPDGMELDSFVALESAKNAASEANSNSLPGQLERLRPFLEAKSAPCRVARQFGWENGVPDEASAICVMSTYCWLRYPFDFQRAVNSGIGLGRSSHHVAAIVGGLVGAGIGSEQLPEPLVKRLADSPHGREWMRSLVERLGHWPHGMEDLHAAPGMPIDPVMQMTRNSFVGALWLAHGGYRRYHRWFAPPISDRVREQKGG